MGEQNSGVTGPEKLYEVQDAEFFYSASLRIFGKSLNIDEVTSKIGLEPTHCHRKGERRGPRSPEYKDNMWMYTAPVREEEPLGEHLKALWEAIRDHRDYLKELKKEFTLDVFCGFRTNCQVTGLEVDHRSLEIFSALEIPFGLSITTLD